MYEKENNDSNNRTQYYLDSTFQIWTIHGASLIIYAHTEAGL